MSVVAIDAKRVKRAGGSDRWEIFTHGGRNATGLDAIEYAQEAVFLGAGEILLTSTARNGTREGYDIDLVRAVSDCVNIPVVAHGGCGTPEHMLAAIKAGADAVAASTMFLFTETTPRQCSQYLAACGIPARVL